MLRPKNAGYFLVLFAPLACAAPDASEDPIEWLGAVPGADLSSGGTGGQSTPPEVGGAAGTSTDIAPAPELVGSIALAAVTDDIIEGGTYPLRALVRAPEGRALGGVVLSWTSSAPSVARVDALTGEVTALTPGTTTIRASHGAVSDSVQLQILPAIVQPDLAMGQSSECGLMSSGKVYCWGKLGFAGRVSSRPEGEPQPVAGLPPCKTIAGDMGTFVALGLDGQAYTWGAGYSGQLGNGTTETSLEPVLVSGGHLFKSVSASAAHVVALTEDGTAYAWGRNDNGELGDGTTTLRTEPVPVATDEKFVQISAGYEYTIALTANGAAYTWGLGQAVFSTGTAEDQLLPVAVTGGHTFSKIVAGYSTMGGLDAGGQLYYWRATTTSSSADPLRLPTLFTGGVTFAALDIYNQFVGIRSDGVTVAWGPNGAGELGDGTYETRDAPVPVLGNHEFTLVRATHSRTIALDKDGSAWVWGFGTGYGQSYGLLTDPAHATPVAQGQEYVSMTLPSTVTVPRGGSVWVDVPLFEMGGAFTVNGVRRFSGEVPVPQLGALPAGVTARFEAPRIARGQTSTALELSASETAALTSTTVPVPEYGEFTVDVVRPAPATPGGDPSLNLRCDVPDSMRVYGYHCLTNSGGASAPHMWRGEELTSGLVNKTWYYENVCITYGAEGRGSVRFRDQHAIPIRWGVLSRSTGVPEVTTTGHWLLYHQGIGDPQIEQLTFDPETETVGEAWPFRMGTCPF